MRVETPLLRALREEGLSYAEIGRSTGIERWTVRYWILKSERPVPPRCPTCGHPPHDWSALPPREYAYLLGIYLGDGTLTRHRKDVWALRVFQDERYPGILAEIANAAAVMPSNRVRVAHQYNGNCAHISSYSKSWPCLFPQHGPGMKHTRTIALTAWQWGYVWQEPGMFVRGLIHSDGCRVTNRVLHGKYEYPRYFFGNESLDIQQLFRDACDLIGVEYANNRRNSISVARRASVARLDGIVGPKT